MTKTATFVSFLVGAAMLAPGCTTGIKEGVGLARGAKGTFMPIQPVAATKDARPLGVYQRFELGPVVDDIGGRTPPELFTHLPEAFQDELRKKKLPDVSGGKTLIIRGKILHYEDAGTLGLVIGPLEEVIVRTELVDKDTGRVLGVANCIGRTEARVNTGVKKKAQGLAKAVVEWIASRYPKAEE